MDRSSPSIFTALVPGPGDLRGRKVTVMGLGLFGGGRGLAAFLCEKGAVVTVTDLAGEEKLAPSLAALEGLPLRYVLGKHREVDFLEADLVFLNPAVPRDAPLVRLCRERGIPLETEMNLFMKLCRGRVCGVTGSNGKTTTTSLIGEIATGELPRTRVGGNLGRSLLGEAGSIRPQDWVVLEVSSFQLEDLASLRLRPEVSVVTNLSPNHLDRHKTYRNYLLAKEVILEPGPAPSPGEGRPLDPGGGWKVLCGDDPRARSWGSLPGRRSCYYGRAGRVLPAAPGVWATPEGEVVARGFPPAGREELLFRREDLRLRGGFNLVNAAGAAAAAICMGISGEGIREGVRRFRPVPSRLELVHSEGGIEFYNDSIATTPESAICALEALGPRVVLIAGGHDKGSSFRELGRVIARRALAAVLIGKTAPAIREAISAARPPIPVHLEPTLEAAVDRARALAREGDRVVLSPACASYDMFVNFEDRGARFTALARRGSKKAGQDATIGPV